jgi:xanthine dehydrogenase accessory factor
VWNWINKLEELRLSSTPVVMVTVTRCTGSTPREAGAKMLVLPDGQFFGTIGGGHFEELALGEAVRVFAEGVSKSIRYPLGAKTGQCCGGTAELFFEILNDGPSLYIFGAGHVGRAVARTMAGTPFFIHLIDERDQWINSREIPSEVIRHQADWSEVVDKISWDNRKSFVIVMTHRHDTDLKIVESLLNKSVRYVGLIGSESKWSRFKQRLKFKDPKFEDEKILAQVRCPIGKKFGGKAPQEIAISIGGDLLEEFYGRTNDDRSAQRLRLHYIGGGCGSAHENAEGTSGL